MHVDALITTVDPDRGNAVADLVGHLLANDVHVFLASDYHGPGYTLYGAVASEVDIIRLRVGDAPLPTYPQGLNLATRWVRHQHPDHSLLLILNDDLRVVRYDWLAQLKRAADRHPDAILGPKLIYPDGRVQHAGGFLLRSGGLAGGHYGEVIEVGSPLVDLERPCEFVTGACMAIPRAVLERLGSFDPSLPAWEDSEFCLRAREHGFETWYVPSAVLEHRTGNDRRPDDYMAKQAVASRMVRRMRWRALWPDSIVAGP